MRVIPAICAERGEGSFEFSASTEIKTKNSFILRELKAFELANGCVNVVSFVSDDTLQEEEYKIEIKPDAIFIKSNGELGALRAASTLKQLVFEKLQGGKALLGSAHISDKPRFSYRGYMLDVSRHFFPVSTVKKLLDAMWLMKLNVFHLHLSDNQGFRVQSDLFPRLNEVGSKRAQTRGDGVPVSGFYTKADVKEIVDYASERGIEVIPEIDMPGHAVAILASYPELSCSGKEVKVGESFAIVRDILCAGKENVFEFLFKLLDEIGDMFPSNFIHIGGDEAPKFNWENCEDCKKAIADNKLRDEEDLQGWFTNRIVEHLKSRGKTAIVWNESLNSGILDKDAVCQYWRDGKRAERVLAAADGGRKIIISRFSPYYLDYPYGMFSLKKAYSFEPMLDGLTSEARRNVLGVEAPLWTEYVEDEEKLFYQTFPRLIAVAESGWSKGEKNFAEFKERVFLFQQLLKTYGISGASLKDSLPTPLCGASKVLKFFANAVDDEVIKSLVNAKKANATRRTE